MTLATAHDLARLLLFGALPPHADGTAQAVLRPSAFLAIVFSVFAVFVMLVAKLCFLTLTIIVAASALK